METFRINLLSTGGTIEKSYIEQDGSFFNQDSIIERVISESLFLPFTQIIHHKILFKDSLEFNDEDREVLYKKVLELEQESCPLIILHGTDTMKKSVQFLEERKKINIPVIFTGAMRPVGIIRSDALQNITEALTYCRVLKSGFYLSFHGVLFFGSNFKKDKQNSRFILD